MFRIGVCDEELSSVQIGKKVIEKFLTENKIEFEIYGFTNRKDLFMYLENEIFDLDILFLDVIIGEDNGLDIAKTMADMNCKTTIIFMTNYMQYCSKVYEVEHGFFGLKKDLEKYLPTIMEKELHRKNNVERERIALMVKGRKIILMLKDILYLEREKRSTQAVCIEETVRTSSCLAELQKQLEKTYFVRCHNSYIVNMTYVKEYCRNELILSNGQQIPVSRSYLNDVRKSIARWLGEEL